MSDEESGTLAITATSWVRATTIGWFVGLLFMIALVIIGEAAGAPSQSVVGIGVGGGLGYWQRYLLRGVIERPWRWVLATVVGMGAPFVLWDMSALVGGESWFSLPACVVAGGLVVALWQWRLLAPHSDRAAWWVPACAMGWAMPALAIGLSDSGWISDPGEFLGLSGIFFGGLMLGAVTGKPLVWILGSERARNEQDNPAP